MREIVLQLKAPETWLSEVAAKHPSKIRILDCKPTTTREGIRQLVEVSASPEELEDMIREIKESPHVKDADIIKTKKERMIGSILTKRSVLCRTVMGTDAFCRTCLFHSTAAPDGSVEWTLAFNGREALNGLLDGLKKENLEVRILKLSSIADTETLTPRQRSLIEGALEEGYFDYPRRITLRKLARKVGVSASTLSEVLRRAEKKIVAAYTRTGGAGEELS